MPGMCVPYLAYMLLGQWVMFKSRRIRGRTCHPSSIYVPVYAVIAAWAPRFVYRTIILNEINKDYVRTARAKGVPFRQYCSARAQELHAPHSHRADNNHSVSDTRIASARTVFRDSRLGDLCSPASRRATCPLLRTTYLTAVLYVVSLLITDVLYAVFDPRIHLR